MRPALVAALSLFGLALASPAAASPETLKRGVSNLLFGPIDFALAPITGAKTVYNNLRDIDDTMGVRVAYAVPGVVWNGAMNMAGAVFRVMTGVMEIPVGIILLPFETDLDPIYAPPERANALIDEEFEWATIKIGIFYVE